MMQQEQQEIRNVFDDEDLIEYEHVPISEELVIPNQQTETINLEDFGDGLKSASAQLSNLAETIDIENFDLTVIHTINSVGIALSSLGTVLCNLATVLSAKQRD
jgi:hypothetical protein